MSQFFEEKLAQVMYLFTDIQKHINTLPFDDQQILYLFFVPRLTVHEISYVYDFTPAEIHLIIIDFLAELFAKYKRLQTFLARLSLPDKLMRDRYVSGAKWDVADLTYKAHLFIRDDQIQTPAGARVRDLIATVIDIGILPVPPQLHTKILSKISVIGQYRGRQQATQGISHKTIARENPYQSQRLNSNLSGQAVGADSKVMCPFAYANHYFGNFGAIMPSLWCKAANQTAMIHRKGEIQTHQVTGKQIENLNPSDFDLFIDIVTGRTTIHLHTDEVITYVGRVPCLGSRSLSLLFALLSEPGKFFSIHKVYRGSTNVNVRSRHGSLSIRLAMLRKSFGENAKNPWFFLTRKPFAIAFSRERSYCIVSPDCWLSETSGKDSSIQQPKSISKPRVVNQRGFNSTSKLRKLHLAPALTAITSSASQPMITNRTPSNETNHFAAGALGIDQ